MVEAKPPTGIGVISAASAAGYRCFNPARRTAFSLLELMVVLAVAVLLTSIMLPALARVRENARRLICSSNMYQIGLAMQMFADDNPWGNLPVSEFGDPDSSSFKPQDMMAAHRGGNDYNAWEGIGYLYYWRYCQSPSCLYCPSHTGDHPFEAYQDLFLNPGASPIFINYHYAGDLVWEGPRKGSALRPRRLGSEKTVIATDGMRTVRDFNHTSGMNVLRGDITVRWRDDQFGDIYNQLPNSADLNAAESQSIFTQIWTQLQQNEDQDPTPAVSPSGTSGL